SFPAEVSSQPMLLDGEEVLLCIVRDISERVRLEAQLRQAQKMEAIGLLAGGIAHDFNNILTPIMAYSDILLSRIPEGDPALRYVDQIAALAERASGLTQQLLAFSRRQVLQPVVLDLNQVLSELEKMLRRLIGENILLHLKLNPALMPVKADTGQMEQVLMNLVVNARDAMPQGGKLSLVTENVVLDEAAAASWEGLRAGNYVQLVARDTGCGMDKETQQHIFEPFYTTKEKGKGTGLGLSTVYGIVAQSGGGIRVNSVIGEGTTFTILLPAVECEMAAAKSAEVEDTAARQGGETILLVEDEPSVQEAVQEILKAYGYTVLVAGSGAEAIRVSAEFSGTIHLLLTDVVMPGMNGCDVAHRLSALRPGIRVLFISGYTDDAVLVQEVREEDAAFLNKPFLPQVLARKIREVLESPAPRAARDV
ncbi:MAG TPA: ATP-binding protein, partial [Armatimonadota bacterium]|nr:ATP-binding protein [Armatimonadota bacterium]